MFATFGEVAKYIADKLLIAVLVVAATVFGNYLLEKYKMSSSISMYDSNEFMKRVDLLWSKAYEVEDAVNEVDGVYSDYNNYKLHDMYKFIWSDRNFDQETEEKKLALSNKFSEYWDLSRQNKFYLGEAITDHIFLYVSLALSISSREVNFSWTIRGVESFNSVDPDGKNKREEELKKEHDEIFSLKELLRQDMKKLRFESAAARKYSLDQKP